MTLHNNSRRQFLKLVGAGAAVMGAGAMPPAAADDKADMSEWVDPEFFIKPEELVLRFQQLPCARKLSFASFDGPPDAWREACRKKLIELLGFVEQDPRKPRQVRSITHHGVTIEAWVMRIGDNLTIPAYLMLPARPLAPGRAVVAIHGHGDAEGVVGIRDDYHHAFGLRLAQAGHIVLVPALRGFGSLRDLAFSDKDRCLDYWDWSRGHQFSLVTDAFIHGRTLIGQTIEDLLRWEAWLMSHLEINAVDVAGISYGGDLAIIYPALSNNVRSIYTSGSMGSFSGIFSRCYNAPAHCVPNILEWMDRSDIAGLSAPRPIRMHYGEYDTPGPKNNSASLNETVEPALAELREIYRAFGAEGVVSYYVTPQRWHEMDNEDLLRFMPQGSPPLPDPAG